MKLEEFVAKEAASLLEFAECWRKENEGRPATFPLEMRNENSWLRQYLAFTARKIEENFKKEEDTKAA